MGSSTRRREGAADRLGDLPDGLLHVIISLLGTRQAVQTSLLSRRWRHLWRDVPCAVIDEREFADDQWERFEDFADRVLTSIPPETQLDAFRLNMVSGRDSYNYAISDRWIRRGLQRFPAVVDIRTAHGWTVRWQPHSSYAASSRSSAPRQPDLSARGSCAAGFTRRLTTLRLVGVNLTPGFLEDLGRHCPVLEHLHIEGCWMEKLHAVASPTLKSLTIVGPHCSLSGAGLRLTAPRLASLRLEIPYEWYDGHFVE